MQLVDQAVKDIVVARPGATTLFRRRRIDFCCHGGRSLREAAASRGLDAAILAAEVEALGTAASARPSQDPPELIVSILSRFHETHRRELLELVDVAHRVEAVHRDHPDRPAGLGEFLEVFGGELIDHMGKEEAVLFPMLSSGRGAMAAAPIMRMRAEHLDHCARLDQLAALTNDFMPPDGACTSWRSLYAGCAKLDGDLREHIHLENFVLFPLFDRPGRDTFGGAGTA